MEKDILVLYHDFCEDGMGAALAAYLKFGDRADYLGIQYKDPMPDVKGKDVYIFDFAFPREILLEPSLEARSITMLDHHLSAQRDWNVQMYADVDRNIMVRFDMGRSGAMLAWDHMFPDEEAPILIKHVQDHDLWKFAIPDTKFFMGNIRSYPLHLPTWEWLLKYTNTEQGYKEFIKEGKAQERFFKSQIGYIFKKSDPLLITLGGVVGGAINANSTFSNDMGHDISLKNGTFGLVYHIEGDEVSCSLRSQKDGNCDVSELCRPYGGGGHKAAAGMKIPIKTFIKEILCLTHCQE